MGMSEPRARSRVVRRFGIAVTVVAVVGSMLAVVDAPEATAGTSLDPATVTAGHWFTCSVDAGGQVLCWGRNDDGQLGDGTTTDRSVPAPVVGIDDAVSVSAGPDHACAILADGTVRCWGRNDRGQLGDGTSGNIRTTPVAVSGLGSVVALALSTWNTCALRTDAEVMCWGAGGSNGDGTWTNRTSPVFVAGLGGGGGAERIAGGAFHTCAIGTNDKVVRCWGNNDSGQVRGQAGTQALSAVVVAGLSGLSATSLGLGGFHSCATIDDGTIRCWGADWLGQLGDGPGDSQPGPATVSGISSATQVAAGYWQSCAVLDDATVKCWGRQTGLDADGTDQSDVPLAVVGLSGAVGVVSGVFHSCANISGGAVCWGNNTYGQLGSNNSASNPPGLSTPIGVAPPDSSPYERFNSELFGDAASTMYVADPVGTSLGNFYDQWVDLPAPSAVFGLDVSRWYNSVDARVGSLGVGWRMSWSESFRMRSTGDGELTLADGRVVRFPSDGAGGWDAPLEYRGVVVEPSSGEFEVVHTDGEVWSFDTEGRIAAKTRWDGVAVEATRDGAGRVELVEASSGEWVEFSYNGTGRLEAIESSDGRNVTYTFGADGFLSGVVGVDGKLTVYEPDGSGRVVRIVDPTGVVLVENTYDMAGRVGSQLTPDEGTYNFVYDVETRTTWVTSVEADETLVYEHDSLGRVIRVIDPDAYQIERTYGVNGWLASGVDRRGAVLLADFDSAGNPQQVFDPKVGLVELTYDSSNRVETLAVPGAGTTTFDYSGGDRLPSEIEDEAGKVTSYTVTDGRITSITDADGIEETLRYYPNGLLEETEDGVGNITTLEYDGAGRRSVIEMPTGDRTEFEYDPAGRVTKVVAADLGETITTYDDAGRVLSVLDAAGGLTEYIYNELSGLLEAVVDPVGHTTSYDYDGHGRRIRATYEDESFTEVDYGVLGRVDATRDELGRETTYAYGPNGELRTVTDPAGGVTETEYDAAGRVAKMIDAMSRETIHTYDDDTGQLVSISSPTGETAYTYDDVGRVVTVTDERGGVTTTTYTDAGRVRTVTDPVGLVTINTYDDAGRLWKVEAPGGRVTETNYDANGRLEEHISPEGLVTSYEYDPEGRVAEVTDPAGVTVTSTWTTRGELATRTRSGEGTIGYAYNLDGTVEWVEDALGNRTTFDYDNRGRESLRVDPDEGQWVTLWNSAGEKVAESDPLSRATIWTYDPAGRVETVSDPSGRTLENTWHADGLLAAFEASDGTYTESGLFTYDASGRRTAATLEGTSRSVGSWEWPYSRTWSYTYTGGGDLESATDFVGRTVTYAYDQAGRLAAMRRPDGTAVLYSYDAAGRVDAVYPAELAADTFTAWSGSLDYEKWDVDVEGGTAIGIDGNNAAVTVPASTGAHAVLHSTVDAVADADTTMSYQFDSTATSIRLEMHQRYLAPTDYYALHVEPNSDTARVMRTTGGTSTEIASFSVPITTDRQWLRFEVTGNTVSARHWVDGDPEPDVWSTSVTDTAVVGNGTPRVEVQHLSGSANAVRIDRWSHHDPDFGYEPIVEVGYDDDDRVVSEILPGGGSRARTWQDGQLTRFEQAGVAGADWVAERTYDASGRLLTEDIDADVGGLDLTYNYDPAGQLLSVEVADGDDFTWTYDDLGRRTSAGIGADVTTFSYDSASQLITTTPSAGSATSHAYDAAGRRTTDTTGTQVTAYSYDPRGRLDTLELPNGDIQLRLHGPDSELAAVINGLDKIDGVWGVGDLWHIDWDHSELAQPVSLAKSSLVGESLAPDNLTTNLTRSPAETWAATTTGSTARAVPSDANRSATLGTQSGIGRSPVYLMWGEPLGAPDSLDPRLGYRGEIHTGHLVHLRARDYDPAAGVFSTTDPLDGISGTPTLNHPYHYADNDPINKIDPTGLTPIADSTFDLYPGLLALGTVARATIPLAPLAVSPVGAALIYGILLGTVMALMLEQHGDIERARDRLEEKNCLNGPNIRHPHQFGELDRDGRATSAKACLTPVGLRGGKPVPYTYVPQGFEEVVHNGESGHRGHLIAAVLGGDGTDPRNVVPLYASANRRMYELWERLVQLALEAGNNVWYESVPLYGQPTSVQYRPTAIQITAVSRHPSAQFSARHPNVP